MKMDVLAILMVAFALFAILMFILFYIFAKRYHNEKSISDDYKDLDNDDDVVVDDRPTVKQEIELVDIWINSKDYVFDANKHQLFVNQEVDVVVNDNTYHGVVTRSNYLDDLANYPQLPTKLVIKEKEETIIPDIIQEIPDDDVNNEDDDFIPRKKNS